MSFENVIPWFCSEFLVHFLSFWLKTQLFLFKCHLDLTLSFLIEIESASFIIPSSNNTVLTDKKEATENQRKHFQHLNFITLENPHSTRSR